jgi:hypothetical protein
LDWPSSARRPHDRLDHASFSQASAVLKRHLGASLNPSPFSSVISAPLRALNRQVGTTFRLRAATSRRLRPMRCLLDLRAEREPSMTFRIRAFYASIKGSELGEQLRTRLNECAW